LDVCGATAIGPGATSFVLHDSNSTPRRAIDATWNPS
jgi:hypothetical protein